MADTDSKPRTELFIGQTDSGDLIHVVREGYSTWITKTRKGGGLVYLTQNQARHDALVLTTAANMADLQAGR
jgi:hypothetical protein